MIEMIKSQYSILMVLISLSLSVYASEVREQPCIDVHAAPDYAGNTPLHKACSSGNIELVRALLARGACVNSTNKSGDTPLHRAVENKHTDVALELLSHSDINVNCYNQYRDTPLHRATFHGLIPVIERLMEKGADINARGSSQDTPLHITVENEYLDVFTKLLSYAGIDVNAANVNGDTPLHRAAYLHRRHKFIPLLLEHGAQVNSVNGLNRTPLFCAVLNGMDESVVLLSRVEGINPNIAGIFEDRKDGRFLNIVITPLCLAFKKACDRSPRIPAYLLSIPGIDLHKRCSRGRTPLIYAIIGAGDMRGPYAFGFRFLYDAIQLLLKDKDIDVNAMDEDKCTALHYAVLSDWAVYTVPLLASCPLLRVDKTNSSGHTALKIAKGYTPWGWDFLHGRSFLKNPKLEPYVIDIEIETRRIIYNWLRGHVEYPEEVPLRTKIAVLGRALHERLGENSPASLLDGFVLRDIAQLLKEEDSPIRVEIVKAAQKQAVVEMIKYLEYAAIQDRLNRMYSFHEYVLIHY